MVFLVHIQVGDECIVAPLSLFQPELFGVTGQKLVHIQQRATGDPEDPHDENYLRETSVSCGPIRFFSLQRF
jgi:actin-related protein 8